MDTKHESDTRPHEHFPPGDTSPNPVSVQALSRERRRDMAGAPTRYNRRIIHATSELAPDLSVTLRLANAALHARTPACYGASASWKPVWR